MQAMNDVSVEVHVPFGPNRGRHRFPAPMPKADDDTKRAYVQAMLREIESVAGDLGGMRAAGVHITGNGPWTLPEGCLDEVLGAIRSCFGLAEGAEVLLDVVPGRFTREQLARSLASGVNRIDVEHASSSFAEFRGLGVPYDLSDFRYTAWMLREEGFRDFGVTVPVGIPAQTEKGLFDTLLEAQAIGVMQVELEPVVLFEGTALAEAYRAGEHLAIPGPAGRAALLTKAAEMLGRYQYRPADNLTFAFEGHQSKLVGLRRAGCEKVGIGCGARSWFGGFAYRNTADVARYIESSSDPAVVCEGIAAVEGEPAERRRVACLLGHPDGVAEPLPGAAWPLAEDLTRFAEAGLVERVEREGGAAWRKTPLGVASPDEFERVFGSF